MIDKDILAQVVLDFHERPLPDLVERDLEVPLELPLRRAVTVMGPRRAGKTYYLFCLAKRLMGKGVEKTRILYFSLEDPRLSTLTAGDLDLLLSLYYELYPQHRDKKLYLILDEVQNVEGWERWVRGVLEREDIQIFLSGSSSRLLSKEIATSLRGRTLSYLLFPFSFAEFLRARDLPWGRYLSSKDKALLMNGFREYLTWGGYPELVLYPQERKRLIQEIIEITIYRDLIERYRIRNFKLIRLMFNYLAKSKEFSVHKFYNFLRSLSLKVSKNNLYNYLEYFHDAFIFFPLRRFSYSLKALEQSIPKIYCVDNAIIEYLAGDDKGRKFENLVFLSLLRRGYELTRDIFYFSEGGGEVDFLVRKEGGIELIQACYDLSDYRTREREINGLLKASDRLKAKQLLIITPEEDGTEEVKGRRIRLIPFWRWEMEGLQG
ncbi:MAG: ATP-binding protein [Deltaproteobacteria bacterium]|nr:MAG: ATP-binding protein [Deltaproteobacteria bacterium]